MLKIILNHVYICLCCIIIIINIILIIYYKNYKAVWYYIEYLILNLESNLLQLYFCSIDIENDLKTHKHFLHVEIILYQKFFYCNN